MFEGSVENTSGVTAATFFQELFRYFANLSLKGWVLFAFGVFAIWFIREGIPMLLIKLGVKGFEEEKD